MKYGCLLTYVTDFLDVQLELLDKAFKGEDVADYDKGDKAKLYIY
jgi:hypothetical protein